MSGINGLGNGHPATDLINNAHLYRFTKHAMYNWGSIEHDYPWADHEVWTGQAQEYPEVECCSKRFALETAITTPGQIHDWIASQLALTSR